MLADQISRLGRAIRYRLPIKQATRLKNRGLLLAAARDLQVEFVNPNIGMFAQMNFCLYMAEYAEPRDANLSVTLSSDNYADPDHSPNWFDYFFACRKPARKKRPIQFSDNGELPFSSRIASLQKANALFFKYFDIATDIRRVVDRFAAESDVGPHTMGVHYRGTDKRLEAAPVPYSVAITMINRSIERHKPRNVFVASDDHRFIETAQRMIGSIPVIFMPDSVRSRDETPIHIGVKKVGNYLLGRDAIANTMMLARCGRLVRTTSFLSAWASVFNPDLKVELLNKPYYDRLWFPERLIVPISPILTQ